MGWLSRDKESRAPETIGERLRRLRVGHGLSQRDLAGPGVSYAYISRIEAGARRPSVKALRVLARKLGVSAEFLETGSEIDPSEQRELRIADAELALRFNDRPQEAERELTRLLEEAVEAGDAVASTRAGVALGLAAAQQSRNKEAIERLEQVIGDVSVSPTTRPDVYATLGHTYSAVGRPERAVELFERCLEQIEEQTPEDGGIRIRFATLLSYALSDVGDFARAQTVLDDVREQAEEIADSYTRVRLYWSLARLAELRGQPAAALDNVRRAIALLEVTEDTLHLARAHLLCGTIMLSQGRAGEATGHFDTAERLFGPQPDPLDLGNLRTDQARVAVRLGRGDDAVERAKQAIATLGDEHPRECGSASWVLAEAHALQGENEEADAAFSRAIELLRVHGHRKDLLETYRAYGRFLRSAGRESEAIDVFERAATLAVESQPRAEP
jgi:tetratricopeptide (TPR) repeat protein